MRWYYSKNGIQIGPVTEADLRSKLTSGEVTKADLVWREGMLDWQPVANVEEFAILPEMPTKGISADREASPYAPPASQASSHMSGGEYVPNYLWQSILVTIFCCWPFGIPAIVYAAKVDGLRARGDLQGAWTASAKAKKWCWVAVGSWAVLIVFWLLFTGIFYQAY